MVPVVPTVPHIFSSLVGLDTAPSAGDVSSPLPSFYASLLATLAPALASFVQSELPFPTKFANIFSILYL